MSISVTECVLICYLTLFVKLSSLEKIMKLDNEKNKNNENQENMLIPDQQPIATNSFVTPNNMPVSLYQTQKYIAVPLTVAEARPLLPVVLVNGKDLDSPEKSAYPPLPSSATANFQFPQYYPSNNKNEIKQSRQFSSRQLNYGKPTMYSNPYNAQPSRHAIPSRHPHSSPYHHSNANHHNYQQQQHAGFVNQIPQSSQHKETLTHALNHPPFFVPKSITAAIKLKQQELKQIRPSSPVDYYDK